MHDYLIGLLRTGVTYAVGALVAGLAAWGVDVTDEIADALVFGVAGLAALAYYALVAALERRWPVFGVLLGKRGAPTFDVDSTTRGVPPRRNGSE